LLFNLLINKLPDYELLEELDVLGHWCSRRNDFALNSSGIIIFTQILINLLQLQTFQRDDFALNSSGIIIFTQILINLLQLQRAQRSLSPIM